MKTMLKVICGVALVIGVLFGCLKGVELFAEEELKTLVNEQVDNQVTVQDVDFDVLTQDYELILWTGKGAYKVVSNKRSGVANVYEATPNDGWQYVGYTLY